MLMYLYIHIYSLANSLRRQISVLIIIITSVSIFQYLHEKYINSKKHQIKFHVTCISNKAA